MHSKSLKIIFIFLAILTLLMFCGCDNSKQDSQTVLIYMCGSTLESKSGEATKNIKELLSATVGENVNVILQTGGTTSWKTTGISSEHVDRYKVENKRLVLIERSQNENFGESQTLTDFINFGLKNYPAKRTSLILWDHGGGSLKGVCMDENFDGDTLTLTELSTALANANLTKKLEFIGFDACLMATYEIASTVAPYANHLVASEEKEPSGGWNYTELLNSLGNDNFYDNLLTSYAEKSSKKYYTLSVVDLSKMSQIDSMISALTQKMIASGKREIINSINASTSFGLAESGLFDLGNLLEYYGIDGYSNFVTCTNSENRSQATGLSIYFPLYSTTSLDYYLTISANQDYNSLLTYFSQDNGETIQFVSYAEEIDNKLSFTLSSDSMPYFAQAEYTLFSIEPIDDIKENVFLLGNDTDAFVENNKVTISFEGRWVEFGGKLLSCTIVDKVGNYTTYQSQVLVNDEEAVLLFGYNSSTQKTDIIGVIFSADDFGRVYQLEEGDSVLIVKRQYEEDVYENVYSNDNEIVYTGQSINVVTLPDGNYQYTAYVRDIYGRTYTAGTAVVNITNGNVQVLYLAGDEVVYPDIN